MSPLKPITLIVTACVIPCFLFAQQSASGTKTEAANVQPFAEMRAIWDCVPKNTEESFPKPELKRAFVQAEKNARAASESFYRCRKFVDGWLVHSDPKSGLIPRNLNQNKDLWNGRDAAADNYPFMVLTCAFTDRQLFETRMLDILKTEIRLTSRVGRLGDHYLFTKQGFAYEKVDIDRLMFDNSEYVKDGLVPITEWLGASPWSDRAIALIEDIWKYAPIETPWGKIPTYNFEVNGDLLQACSRFYWFTGETKYLDWSIRLGDYYLLGTNHPTRNLKELRLIDHGCEVVNGLSELYVAVAKTRPDKKRAYEKPLREIFDCILEKGRNQDGMLYSQFNPKTGEHSPGLCDTWGYAYDGFYTMFQIDHVIAYREAVQKALSNLEGKYVGACWSDRSADGFADSIEGAINLINREPNKGAENWIESQIRMMWAIQKSTGIIEAWHGDGNIARTSLMYALWKTQGLHVEPWREDVHVGAVLDQGRLCVSISADKPWSGKLYFDRPRHRHQMKLPMDYPRINQFPEWFTVDPILTYAVGDLASPTAKTYAGKELLSGLSIELTAGEERRIVASIIR